MKTVSSTHFEIGLRPAKHMISVAMSIMRLNWPAFGEQPKLACVSIAKLLSESSRTTVPDHCDGCKGMFRYASATSQTHASEPGGRRATVKANVVKVPYVHGKLSGINRELIDVYELDGACRYKKFCTRRKDDGLCGFGIMERGEVWKGPSAHSTSASEKGPR